MSILEIIGVVASVVSAIVGVIGIWKSNWFIRMRIERKQRQIQDIETALFRKYRANRPIFGMDKLDWKEKQLQEDIRELKRDYIETENTNNCGGLWH